MNTFTMNVHSNTQKECLKKLRLLYYCILSQKCLFYLPTKRVSFRKHRHLDPPGSGLHRGRRYGPLRSTRRAGGSDSAVRAVSGETSMSNVELTGALCQCSWQSLVGFDASCEHNKPRKGVIVISPTSTSSISVTGHVGMPV